MRGRKLLVVGVVVLFAALLGTVLVSLLSNSPTRKLSDEFVAGVLSGDATNTYSKLAPSTQITESPDTWAATVTRMSNFFKGGTAEFDKTTSSDATEETSATNLDTYTIAASDGTYQLSVLWTKSDGEWVVQVFNSALVGTP